MTCPPDSGRQARVPSVGEGLAAAREPPPPAPSSWACSGPLTL